MFKISVKVLKEALVFEKCSSVYLNGVPVIDRWREQRLRKQSQPVDGERDIGYRPRCRFCLVRHDVGSAGHLLL